MQHRIINLWFFRRSGLKVLEQRLHKSCLFPLQVFRCPLENVSEFEGFSDFICSIPLFGGKKREHYAGELKVQYETLTGV